MVRISATEANELSIWLTTHLKLCAAQGEMIEIKQSSESGIGVKTTVKCGDSAEHDITDYSLW